jgi:heme/copper-type cytochrome/quinol oxidase subunit 2
MRGLYILGIILLIILLVVGILIIVYRNRIFSTNPNFGTFLGVVIIIISVSLLIWLIYASYKTPKLRKVLTPAILETSQCNEKVQFQTNKAVMITISPIEVPKTVEIPKPFEIIKINTPEIMPIAPTGQINCPLPTQNRTYIMPTNYSTSTYSPNYVTTSRVPIPERVVATI